jgi:hypothetical protein
MNVREFVHEQGCSMVGYLLQNGGDERAHTRKEEAVRQEPYFTSFVLRRTGYAYNATTTQPGEFVRRFNMIFLKPGQGNLRL